MNRQSMLDRCAELDDIMYDMKMALYGVKIVALTEKQRVEYRNILDAARAEHHFLLTELSK